MHLPSAYKDSGKYFHDVLNFLSEYRWIYNFPVTGLLVHGVLDQVPADWIEALLSLSTQELNDLPNGYIKESWPQSLQDFCRWCQALKLPVDHFQEPCLENCEFPSQLKCGVNPKKQHEVCRLVALIHQECLPRRITKILDVGSGLGYLGQVLHHCYGYQVLGLESDSRHVRSAIMRQHNFCFPDGKVSYKTCDVSLEAEETIWEALHETLLGKNCVQRNECEVNAVCMVGLHPCGDLSVIASQLFLKHPSLHLFITLPCCYHKMSLSDDCSTLENQVSEQNNDHIIPESFSHFPLSNSLKKHVEEEFMDARMFLRRPLLRLASQETCIKWKNCTFQDHEEHSMNLMSRAVLYLYAHNAGLILKKKHRRGVRKSQLCSFDTILDDMLLRYDFIQQKQPEEQFDVTEDTRKKVTLLWNEYKSFCRLAEAITGLQIAAQAAVESFLLIDKMVYLQEKDTLLSCEVLKVLDNEFSPRCHALIARKLAAKT